MSALQRLFQAGRAYAIVGEVTRDPDPEPTHEYVADPQSGAGNCVCGMAEAHRRDPHYYTGSRQSNHCVCGLPAEARCHQ